MKIDIHLRVNHNEIQKAREMGISIPKEKFELRPFVFNVHNVHSIYVDLDGDMIIEYNGDMFSAPFKQETWDTISNSIETRETIQYIEISSYFEEEENG